LKRRSETRSPRGIADYLALALTTFGVGYIPGAPGTYGSVVGVGIYLLFGSHIAEAARQGLTGNANIDLISALHSSLIYILIFLFVLIGVWGSSRSIAMLGSDDPHEAVVDEVMGQIITFLFIPFTLSWPLILAGFVLFRLFDIWKPYPIDSLQSLPGGLGICADDIVAGVYAGICLAVINAIILAI
jgi:phosphatidylglycerophosphatase A